MYSMSTAGQRLRLSTLEMIMSTLAWELAGEVAPAELGTQPGFLSRLIKSREDRAKHVVLRHLATMDDARLGRLGFTNQDISALRAGELRLPR